MNKIVTILVIEDEENIRKLISKTLTKNGYNILEASDGEKALKILDANYVDLIITDIMMPNVDGLEFTKDLRNAGYQIPILMATAKETLDDKKLGFLVGADDYMVKPIDIEEMLIRVSALLRRAKIANDKKLIVRKTVLDYESYSITANNQTIELPKKEFQVLFKLLSNPNKIFTRLQLMDEIWGLDAESDERTVDVHIKRLRERLAHIRDFEIITIRGLGYKGKI